MKTKTLGFIGGGRITKIILQAMANKQIDLSSVLVCDINTDVLNALKKQYPKIKTTDSCVFAAKQDIVFIALHPPVIMETLEQIKTSVSEKTLVISLAPKISIEKFASILTTKNIARMIPNASSLINDGYNPVTFAGNFDEKKKNQVLKLLKTLGKTFETEEVKLESFAIVSAMLPTYFWFQWQEMEKIAQETGLSEEEAKKTVRQSLKKAWKLYYKSNLSPDEVMDLIPVKPIGEHEAQISEIYQTKLMGLFKKIKTQL